MKFYKALKLYFAIKHYSTKRHSVEQGCNQGEHMGHCSKMTSLSEYFFKFMSKASRPCFWSVIAPIKLSGYTRTTVSLSVQHI